MVYFRLQTRKKWSTVGLCSGIICGLVAATPSSGCITLYGSLIQGIVAGICCNFATKIKHFFQVDDAMDLLAEHGVAGMIGLLFNGFLLQTGLLGWMDTQHMAVAGSPKTINKCISR